jgi:hypothetical protein
MSGQTVFVSRLVRLPLLDSESSAIGKIDDVVLALSGDESPRVLGYVAVVQRRRIFVNVNRVAEISPTGAYLRSGTIDLRVFKQRAGEYCAVADLIGTKVDEESIVDLSIGPQEVGEAWGVHDVALGRRGPLRRRRPPQIVPWSRVATAFQVTEEETEVAELRDLHPTDVAERLRNLPLERRQRLAELLEDERLADLIEEVDDQEAVRIIESLDVDRAAHVLEEMEPDDAVDLLADLPDGERFRLLDAMDPEEATPLRRLLAYDEHSAGGLMTPEPVILPFTTTVAEALARIRTWETPAELAAQVFVVRPPTSVPTGKFLGVVGFQRLLREPPASTLEHIVGEGQEPISPEMPLREVAERVASYDLLALPVCDAAGRLIGAVTVDDVLDQLLPEGWRGRGVRR